MKEKNLLTIVNLYVNDDIFMFKRLLTPRCITSIASDKIAEKTAFIPQSNHWHLEMVKLKDEYIVLYEAQGNRPRQFYDEKMLYVLDLVRGEEKFKALYFPYLGKVVIFPAAYLESKVKKFCWSRLIMEENETLIRRKVKERYYFCFANCLFFMKERQCVYSTEQEQESLYLVKCRYML